jgi:adenylate cyclase
MIARLLGYLDQRPQLVRLLLPIVLAVFVGAVSFLPQWESVELKGFDALTRYTAVGAPAVPIIIVGIDESSFSEINQQWPWPRSMHARLVDALHEAGASVIAFDVTFFEPDSRGPAEDEALAAAIKRAGNVVLGADLFSSSNEKFGLAGRMDPLHIFLDAGAHSALISVSNDPDSGLRRIPDFSDAFFREVIRTYARRNPGAPADVTIAPGSMIRFVGPDHTFPYVSYYQALKPNEFLPKGIFKDRIVMIGRDVKVATEVGAQQVDMFITPYLQYTHQLMPGVEVHANMIDGSMTGRNIYPMPTVAYLALTVLMTLLAGIAMREWQPLRSLLLVMGLVIALTAASYALFDYGNYWVKGAAPIAGMVMVYIANGGLAFLLEQRRKQEIKRAWSFYVSPAVVNQMIEHPDQLVLGGQKREVTLMFTDLAGFTSISEKLTPEQVSHLLNRHLTEMTRIVIAHGGTVDKFIGDAVMAFWGAPLDDPDQAKNACEAARDMQKKMQSLRTELQAEGLPEVFMRIGLHTGPAVVGNMGSEERFDYTAIGDTVNLASRLEGANKAYGTDILLSEATASRLNGALPLRVVDNVKVKGKLEPVEVFTIDDDEEVGNLTGRGVAAFRSRRWDESTSFWQALLMRRPHDSVAELYLQRIAAFRAEPPAADWDGAIALDSK